LRCRIASLVRSFGLGHCHLARGSYA
jgi:hypothetical protein